MASFPRWFCIPLLVAAAFDSDIHNTSFNLDGYVCEGQQTLLWAPAAPGKFPVVVYLHGDIGGVDGQETAMGELAASGFVVLAPATGGFDGSCKSSTEWQDAVTLIGAAKTGGEALSADLARADWNRIGIWGYSMGGKAAPRVAAQADLGIGALVCSHGARRSTDVSVPSMYLTGDSDDSSSPADVMWQEYEANKADHKVYLNIENGTHQDAPKRNSWVFKFFDCHLAGTKAACASIYGTDSGSLCEALSYDKCVTLPAGSTTVI